MIYGAPYQRVATYSVMNPELSSREAAERAKLKSAIFKSQLAVKKQAGRLQISVKNIYRVNSLKASESLVDKVLAVIVE